MPDAIEQTLASLGITLPTPVAPVANYVPYVVTGNLVFISGPGSVRGRQSGLCRQASSAPAASSPPRPASPATRR